MANVSLETKMLVDSTTLAFFQKWLTFYTNITAYSKIP